MRLFREAVSTLLKESANKPVNPQASQLLRESAREPQSESATELHTELVINTLMENVN